PKFNHLFFTITFILFPSTADHFSIYIPYFTTLTISQIFILTILFLIILPLFSYLTYPLPSFHFISQTIHKYQPCILPILFIPLRIYIFFQNPTFNPLIS
ncbi:cadmium resistance transporter, partial [Staphylococcus warneri]|uniref:cadmium resistance transporter n=1 Tax=Staphylococcus warneri TaxID=1292 RepID=UPI0016438A6F